ncbi:MAG: DUF512 domain-containing protein [Eubacteriales bacterium]
MTPISAVSQGSPAHRAGVSVGDRLISINQNPILDVLDYKFYSYDTLLMLELCDEHSVTRTVSLTKQEGEDLGLEFATYLMDDARPCTNNCIFCFVHQMPKNMRKSLYFKDDDARLSFLTGNYITLTNLSPREIERIIALRISPINISVHTTDRELRASMLKNPCAAECLSIMESLAKGGITMNCQIVACPTINDGEALTSTLRDLATLYPQVQSVAVVPVGLTKFRDHLPHLDAYTKESATVLLDQVEVFAQEQLQKLESRFVWCSDEFYLLAERPLPSEEDYEGYVQLDNGVGMLRSLEREFVRGLSLLSDEELTQSTPFVIATGTAAAPLITRLVSLAQEKSPSFSGEVIPILNDFFGHSVVVAGLITGSDLIAQLRGRTLPPRLLLPESMLRYGEDVFLDDVTVAQVEEALGVTITPVPQDGFDLCDAIFNQFTPSERTITPPMTDQAFAYRQNI